VHKRIISAVKKVEFVSGRMSYIILRVRWYHIIVLNVQAPTEDKTDDKDSVYEELEQAFNKFPKYHIKILLDFNAKVGREDIFKLTIGNENLLSSTLTVKSMIYPHSNIHKYTWMSPDGKTHNQMTIF
jgi:hypothetical protein